MASGQGVDSGRQTDAGIAGEDDPPGYRVMADDDFLSTEWWIQVVLLVIP
jgi:hypothetical protein